jgi:aminoglycoside phosphotransferase (APT) family kinase protein
MTLHDPVLIDHPHAAQALRAAFGAAPVTGVRRVTGGFSGARVFRLEAEGGAWLLRLPNGRDAFRDPARWIPCLRIAAEAGIAPPLRYADLDTGACITRFIEGRPLAEGYGTPRAAMIGSLGAMARRLHATPAFPPLVDYMDGMAGLIDELRRTGLLTTAALDQELAGYDALNRAYRALSPEPVSSHNDLNPRNILVEDGRLWVVDWEAAFLADRYVDLATLANNMTRDEAELAVLTAAYFGRPPSPAESARLFLARQVNRVFYGVMFLSGLAAERPAARIAPGEVQADLDAVRQALAQGRFPLDTCDGRLVYGLAHLRAARASLADLRFAEAVRLAR